MKNSRRSTIGAVVIGVAMIAGMFWLFQRQVDLASEQRIAIAEIERITRGGWVGYWEAYETSKPGGGPYEIESLKTPPVPMFLRHSLGDDFFFSAYRVQLTSIALYPQPTINNRLAQLKPHLEALHSLEVIDFTGTDLDDTGIRHLGNMLNSTRLKFLIIRNTRVTDAGRSWLNSQLPDVVLVSD